MCVVCSVHVSQGCLAEPETQLLALIDFSDREDFPVQGYTPSNRLRSLLAGKEAPISVVKWNLSTLVLTRWLGEVTQGPEEVAGRTIAASLLRKEEEPNCRRHPPDPMELAAVHNFPLSWLRGVHHSYENLAGSTNQRLSFSLFCGGTLFEVCCWFLFSISSPFCFEKGKYCIITFEHIGFNKCVKYHIFPCNLNVQYVLSFFAFTKEEHFRNKRDSFALGICDCTFQELIFFPLFTLCCSSSSCLVCGPSCSS